LAAKIADRIAIGACIQGVSVRIQRSEQRMPRCGEQGFADFVNGR